MAAPGSSPTLVEVLSDLVGRHAEAVRQELCMALHAIKA
jgi:hypothetical protein